MAIVWDQFSPYHLDRCRQLAADLRSSSRVIGIQTCPRSSSYSWVSTTDANDFELITLFPDKDVEAVKPLDFYFACCRIILRQNVTHLFIPGYHKVEFLAAAISARFFGCKCYLMLESKFEDQARRLPREILKSFSMIPFQGALVGGELTLSYLRFLGFNKPVELGYDSVSGFRIRANAGQPSVEWDQRSFVVIARLVKKKNLSMLLSAFAMYKQISRHELRTLRICGSGPLEMELRAQAESLGLGLDVIFLGFQQERTIAAELGNALCLLLPSTEEQWGLVVNEAVSLGVPIIISDRVGARELLVKSMLNGFILEPDNIEGWARAMDCLATDEGLWRRFSMHSLSLWQLGDTTNFSSGARRLMKAA